MPALKGLEWTFDTVASTYEKLRPGYVKELYQTLFDYISINENSNVVEVGRGGGQATAPILTTGCQLIAVEYGEQFSELLKEKFKEYPKFSVITGKFEVTTFDDNAFDLVFSASAFHWVPEKIGYEKVFSMLKKGGVFARFANHPYRDKGNLELSNEIDQIYVDQLNIVNASIASRKREEAYYITKDRPDGSKEKIYGLKCDQEQAFVVFGFVVREQQKEYRASGCTIPWRIVRLYNSKTGKQICQES